MEKPALTEDLVRAAAAGSRSALEEIVGRIQGRIYGLALRMLYHPADAEDATQEILIKVITRLDGFRGDGPFPAWVYRIAVNHLKSVRKNRWEQRESRTDKAQRLIDRAQTKNWFDRPRAAPARPRITRLWSRRSWPRPSIGFCPGNGSAGPGSESNSQPPPGDQSPRRINVRDQPRLRFPLRALLRGLPHPHRRPG